MLKVVCSLSLFLFCCSPIRIRIELPCFFHVQPIFRCPAKAERSRLAARRTISSAISRFVVCSGFCAGLLLPRLTLPQMKDVLGSSFVLKTEEGLYASRVALRCVRFDEFCLFVSYSDYNFHSTAGDVRNRYFCAQGARVLNAMFPFDVRDGRVCWFDGRAYLLVERSSSGLSQHRRSLSETRRPSAGAGGGGARRRSAARTNKLFASTQRSLNRLELTTRLEDIQRLAATNDASLSTTQLAGVSTQRMLSNPQLIARIEFEYVVVSSTTSIDRFFYRC